MEKQSLLKANYLDILYDNRNKKYGGYELRSKYPDRAKKATYIVLLAAGLLSSIPVIAGILDKSKGPVRGVVFTKRTITISADLPKDRPVPKPSVKPAQAPAITPTVAVRVLTIVPTDKVPDDAPRPVDSLGNRTAGLNNNDGHADGLVADNGQADGQGPIPGDPPLPIDPPLKKTSHSCEPDAGVYWRCLCLYEQPHSLPGAGKAGR